MHRVTNEIVPHGCTVADTAEKVAPGPSLDESRNIGRFPVSTEPWRQGHDGSLLLMRALIFECAAWRSISVRVNQYTCSTSTRSISKCDFTVSPR
jgi:hypothetical protein